MVEGQPKEVKTKSPREKKPKKWGRIVAYSASAALFGSGVIDAINADDGYNEFLEQHPHEREAENVISDTDKEIERIFRENDDKGLEEVRKRLPIISAAYSTKEEFADKIPSPFEKANESILKMMGAAIGGMAIYIISSIKDQIVQTRRIKKIKERYH